MAYSFVWRAVCGAIGGLGIALGLIVLPLELLIPFVLLTIVVGLTAAVGHTSTEDQQDRRTSRQIGVLAALPFLALLAFAGLSFALGPVALLLALAMVATSPPVVHWYGDSPSWPQPEELDESTASTAQLCRQWHDSFEDLHQAVTPAARLRIVASRQRCLDELERRNPAGLNAWLSSTATPNGDPTRFLRTNQSKTPPPDS